MGQKLSLRPGHIVAGLVAMLVIRPLSAYATHGTYWYAGAGADGNGWYAYVYADNPVDQTGARIGNFNGEPENGGQEVNAAGRFCGSYGAPGNCTWSSSNTASISIPSGNWYRAITCARDGSHIMGGVYGVSLCGTDTEYYGDISDGEIK
jgi:hypothetical protein